MAPKTLVRIILILSAAFIIGLFVMGITKVMTKGGDVENCRTSIIAAAQSKKLPTTKGIGRPIANLNCPRQEFVLYKKDIVEKGEINQDKAHKRIADAMAECWYMVGEGKMDPFSDWEDKNKNYCLICKTIKFDKKLERFISSHADDLNKTYLIEKKGLSDKKATTKVKENIKKYMVTTEKLYVMEHSPKHSDKTYYEYLFNEEPPEISEEIKENLSYQPFIPGSTVFVNMYRYKAKSTAWKVVGIGATVVLIVGGLFLSPFTFGGSLLVSAAGLSTLTATIIAIAVIGGGGWAAYATADKAFESCEDCGIGGIQLLPPYIPLSEEQTICVENCNTDDPKYEYIPYCSLIVN